MRLPFKKYNLIEVIEAIIILAVANFISITMFAGMVFCLLECKAPWGKQ